MNKLFSSLVVIAQEHLRLERSVGRLVPHSSILGMGRQVVVWFLLRQLSEHYVVPPEP